MSCGYLDLSATGVERDDADDVSAVGVSLQAAEGVAGLTETQLILTESTEGRFLHLYSHFRLRAGHLGFN